VGAQIKTTYRRSASTAIVVSAMGKTPTGGYIKTYRAIRQHPVWDLTPAQYKVWTTILLMANFQEGDWWDGASRVSIPPGSFVTSEHHLAKESGRGITRRIVQRAIQSLIRLESISVKTRDKRYTEIIVNNWPSYQCNGVDSVQEEVLARYKDGTSAVHNVRRKEGKKERKIQEPSPRALPESAIWPSPLALFLKYNREATDNCPAITSVSPGRMKKAQEYLAMFPDEAWWTRTFRQYHLSRFLNGTEERTNGHKGFQPDLDWLLSKGKTDGIENCVKVHDGRYSDA
jgi:hypothetical protein